MISAAVISGSPPSGIRSFSTISASGMSTGWRLRLAKAVTRISAPSSSRMLVGILRGDELEHVGRRGEPVLRGLLAQDRDPGLEVGRLDVGDQAPLEPVAQPVLEGDSSCLGGRSEVSTICLLALCRVLKVWKNSSWVWLLPSRNWMSSISRTSTSR